MTINKEFLLEKRHLIQMYVKEDFEFDDEVIAIYSIDNCVFGKSIVHHTRYGWFFVDRTSTELINSYWKMNVRGFLVSRSIAEISNLKNHLPLVDGHIVYVPLSGKKSRTPDWIGLHHIEDYQHHEDKKLASFKTIHGDHIQFSFDGPSLRQKIHDGSFMSEFHLQIITHTVSRYGSFKVYSERAGITDKFRHCSCNFHSRIPRTQADVLQFWNSLFIIIFRTLAKNDIGTTLAESLKVQFRLFNKVRRW
ncbi:hypothetical protein [Companilactobacillus sp.]|uniref:hypothetical protein n=1 Tax=Companilactobacillus sp. TaxID=2767905 RepID=UPI00261105BF|nr:hypothetical protein [Companilactobacillus sp.]